MADVSARQRRWDKWWLSSPSKPRLCWSNTRTYGQRKCVTIIITQKHSLGTGSPVVIYKYCCFTIEVIQSQHRLNKLFLKPNCLFGATKVRLRPCKLYFENLFIIILANFDRGALCIIKSCKRATYRLVFWRRERLELEHVSSDQDILIPFFAQYLCWT